MTRVAMVDDLELELPGVESVHAPPSPLALTNAEVARFTRTARERRLDELLDDSRRIMREAIEQHVTGDGKQLAAVVSLFSGGTDSTVATHLAIREGWATHAGHANTTVGIESTRQFVRERCEAWGLPLLERRPPRLQDQYRALVLTKARAAETGKPLGGFPGPRLHWKMYQRLKERAIEQMQRELVDGRGRTHRVVFIAGRRRDESRNRSTVPEHERKASRVWSSPMVHWTKLDLNTYRLRAEHEGDPVPVSRASCLIHMSGECLCGSYVGVGERAELEAWFPDDLELIRELEAILATPEYAFIPEHRRTWGWAGIPELAAKSRLYDAAELEPVSAGLCDSCAPHADQLALFST